MEKHLHKVKKIFLSILITLTVTFTVTSQAPSLLNHIRFTMWADVDAYPELEGAMDYEGYEYPIECIRDIAPFIVNGMVYGWEFSYTPSDKARGVKEYLEVKEIVPVDYIQQKIKYSDPWIDGNNFNCWIDYDRNEYEIQNYNLWKSIKNPVITGTGYGETEIGFEGIKEAAKDALKNAVRNHYRNVVKNKPKEITGRVLVRDIPTIGIDAGKYVIILDFFLEWGKIIEYRVF